MTQIFVNHLGYLPQGSKFFVVDEPGSPTFQVVNRASGSVVLDGKLQRQGTDLGSGMTGCFTAVTEPGTYTIRCAAADSVTVVIDDNPYELAVKTLYNYFPTQRCGDSQTGWHSPCHTRKVRDAFSGELLDLQGGWHQSCDTRKWIFGTVHGLFGLAWLGHSARLGAWARPKVEEELRWGNSYFHKMVRPDGGLMDHIAIPNDWDDRKERILYSNDAPAVCFFEMIAGQCHSAQCLGPEHPEAAAGLAVAVRLWDYATGGHLDAAYTPKVVPEFHEWLPYLFAKSYLGSSLYWGVRLYAAVALFETTRDQRFAEAAAAAAVEYCRLQVSGPEAGAAAGSFWQDAAKADLDAAIYDGFWGPLGLCRLAAAAPDHPDLSLWKTCIGRVAEQALASSARNPWGLVACYWYRSDPGGGRPAENSFYKYFSDIGGFLLGNNLEILGKALFLLEAAPLTSRPVDCIDVAHRQVDWVLGCNPFDSSTVEGLGRNQRPRLINAGEFVPPTPQIAGAVMTGVGARPGSDTHVLGDWCTVEYDMPPTAFLIMVLVTLLERSPIRR